MVRIDFIWRVIFLKKRFNQSFPKKFARVFWPSSQIYHIFITILSKGTVIL